jgi:peptidoglycan/xylan/chitin deacetylase (PgdA/CDA1 family)
MKSAENGLISNAKQVARYLAGSISLSAPLRPVARRILRRHTNVVFYHIIGARQPYYHSRSDREYTMDQFSRDLASLGKFFVFTTLQKICEHNQGGSPSNEPLLAITFDDGLSLNYPELMQVFDHHGVKATQFLIMSCVDNLNLMWRHKISAIEAMVPDSVYVAQHNVLASRAGYPSIKCGADFQRATRAWSMARKDELADELWRACDMPALAEFLDEYRPYLTWKEIDGWLGAGHSIGLHTLTHPFCSRLTDDEIETEITQPAAGLRSRFSLDFLPFAYPFGDRMHVAKERALLARGVFECAFGIRGFARAGTAQHLLERAGIEEWGGIGWPVFGRSLIAYGLTGSGVR